MKLHPPAGLCDSCRWQKVIRNTRGSRFSMCTNPDLPKYPRLPVRECRGYEKRPARPAGHGDGMSPT